MKKSTSRLPWNLSRINNRGASDDTVFGCSHAASLAWDGDEIWFGLGGFGFAAHASGFGAHASGFSAHASGFGAHASGFGGPEFSGLGAPVHRFGAHTSELSGHKLRIDLSHQK